MLFAVDFLFFIGVFAISQYVLELWRNQKTGGRKYPPSLPSLPIVGSMPFIRGFNNVADFFMKKSGQLGPIFTLKVGNRLFLVLNSKETIEEAYLGHSYSFSERHHMHTEQIANPNRRGLASMNTTPEWKKYHHMSLSIMREFGFGIKSVMEGRILTEVEAMVEHVRKNNGQAFDPKDTLAVLAVNIVSNIILGNRSEYELGVSELGLQIRHFFESMDPTFDVVPIVRFLPRFRHKFRLLTDSMKKMKTIISNEIQKGIIGGIGDCFLRRYLEKEGVDCDKEQLLFTIRDLTAPGSDTVIGSLLWSLVALANHQEIQDRLRAEIDATVPRERFPSMSDMNKLPYAQATILEIMRWKTLVPLSVPRATLRDDQLRGYFIPAGSLVLANLYAVHMNPETWKDPDAFRPERFLDEDMNVIGKDRIIPFSLGRRSCLGEVLARAELFLIINSLVQRFFILPPEELKAVDVKPLEPIGLTLIPLAFKVRLIERE